MADKTKIIEILDPVAASQGSERAIKETVIQESTLSPEDLREVLGEFVGRRKTLLETATTTSHFPQLLQDGLRTILFNALASNRTTWQEWCDVVDSNRPDEQWLKDSAVGLLPIVGEGDPYPELDLNLDSTLNITNKKRGGIIVVTEEMVRFDRYNIIRAQAADLGAAMAATKDQDAYDVLTTTTNYVRNSTTADNDVGANTATATFSAQALSDAIATLRTMKDRKSGRYLDVNPDTLIVGPRSETFVKQLIFSPALVRQHGNTTVEKIGTGTDNPFSGMFSRLIVSPRMSSPAYAWALMEAKRAVVCQNVYDVRLVNTEGVFTSHDFFHRGVIKFRADAMYGFGMKDDRFAYYSDSTTEPIID